MEYTWKSETIEALKTLGGIAHVSDILNEIKKRNNLDLSHSKTPDRTLSKTLTENCLETTYGKDNTFYSVYGIKAKEGVWGLTDYFIERIDLDLTTHDEFFYEGKVVLRKHLCRERNSNLVAEAKRRFKEKHEGKLFCEICEFSFSDKYGELGADFIEAHHTKPVSEMKDGDKTNINDIVMVCSNCHSMLHKRRPWLNKEDVKKLIEKQV